MLEGVGKWMKINGEGIYGSKAWEILGEGENNRINTIPGGSLGKRQADFRFGPKDFRFTVGKDGSLYAWCMTVPPPGAELRITSLGSTANRLKQPIKSVELLGSSGSVQWKQETDALVITCPNSMPFSTAIGFKISTK
jgi:alpha-L-fucosidase